MPQIIAPQNDSINRNRCAYPDDLILAYSAHLGGEKAWIISEKKLGLENSKVPKEYCRVGGYKGEISLQWLT
jgi:hypothetical protein